MPTSAGMDEATQQGVMALMQKLQKNPTDLEALVGLTEHFMHTQDWRRAETFALRAVVAAPNETQPLYMLGIIQHSQNRNAEAAASLERSVAAREDPSRTLQPRHPLRLLPRTAGQGPRAAPKALDNPNTPADLKKAVAEEVTKIKEHKNHTPQQAQ